MVLLWIRDKVDNFVFHWKLVWVNHRLRRSSTILRHVKEQGIRRGIHPSWFE